MGGTLTPRKGGNAGSPLDVRLPHILRIQGSASKKFPHYTREGIDDEVDEAGAGFGGG